MRMSAFSLELVIMCVDLCQAWNGDTIADMDSVSEPMKNYDL